MARARLAQTGFTATDDSAAAVATAGLYEAAISEEHVSAGRNEY